MTNDEQQLAALLNALPGRDEADFWRGVKAAAGLSRIRATMSAAVREAEEGVFGSLAGLVLDAFGQDARHKALTDVLAGHLGGTLQARSWIADAVTAAGRIKRASTADPLETLAKKW
ncbi:hypothetical protein [Streptomyces sp. NPDC093707]|uniref:hypothetical protein n=1 Tax=Streptomyces sp. NPDC093707 TaxID=3154984 RepID=UPI00344B99F7